MDPAIGIVPIDCSDVGSRWLRLRLLAAQRFPSANANIEGRPSTASGCARRTARGGSIRNGLALRELWTRPNTEPPPLVSATTRPVSMTASRCPVGVRGSGFRFGVGLAERLVQGVGVELVPEPPMEPVAELLLRGSGTALDDDVHETRKATTTSKPGRRRPVVGVLTAS